jgi:hypothetical protein
MGPIEYRKIVTPGAFSVKKLRQYFSFGPKSNRKGAEDAEMLLCASAVIF